jgi:flagellar FliL protein
MFGKKKKKKGEEAEEHKEGAEGEGGEGKEATEGAEGAEGGEAGGEHGDAPKKSKKKLIIIVVGAVVLLAVVGAGLYFSGIIGGAAKKKEVPEGAVLGPDGKPIEKPVFYTLPDFLVNLNTSGKTASFLKVSVVIELAHQTDVPLVEAQLPRISDAFTTYLRELRPSDLAGSSGIQRLREELLLRVNRAIAPTKVNDVLFKEIVVQ